MEIRNIGDIHDKYRKITNYLIDHRLTITTMESATAGLIASLLTDTEGASAVIKGAFVTYSNEAKLLQGVPEEIISEFGVYSKETARAMAAACKEAYKADIGIGITGTFGNPDPANRDSVPGEAYFCIDYDKDYAYHFSLPKKKTRYDYKLEVAKLIEKKLSGLLK